MTPAIPFHHHRRLRVPAALAVVAITWGCGDGKRTSPDAHPQDARLADAAHDAGISDVNSDGPPLG